MNDDDVFTISNGESVVYDGEGKRRYRTKHQQRGLLQRTQHMGECRVENDFSGLKLMGWNFWSWKLPKFHPWKLGGEDLVMVKDWMKTRNVCVALVCPAKRRSHGTPVHWLPLRTDTTKTVCSAKAGHKKGTRRDFLGGQITPSPRSRRPHFVSMVMP